MDVQRVAALLTAFGSATTRRRIVRGLLAGAGGSALVRFSEGPVAARSRCCRRARRAAKEFCLSIGGGCTLGPNFSCTKLGPGLCESTIDCEGGDPAVCP